MVGRVGAGMIQHLTRPCSMSRAAAPLEMGKNSYKWASVAWQPRASPRYIIARH